MTNEQQTILLAGAGLLVAFTIFKKWRLGGNKVKLKEMLQKGAKVIDVRSPGEYAGGHYAGAINIPLDALPGKLNSLGDKAQPIIVYCASGMRSESAAKALRAAGFANVENGVNQGNLQGL